MTPKPVTQASGEQCHHSCRSATRGKDELSGQIAEGSLKGKRAWNESQTVEWEVLCDIQAEMQLWESSGNRGSLKLRVQHARLRKREYTEKTRGPKTHPEWYQHSLVESRQIKIRAMGIMGEEEKPKLQQHLSRAYYIGSIDLHASHVLINLHNNPIRVLSLFLFQ